MAVSLAPERVAGCVLPVVDRGMVRKSALPSELNAPGNRLSRRKHGCKLAAQPSVSQPDKPGQVLAGWRTSQGGPLYRGWSFRHGPRLQAWPARCIRCHGLETPAANGATADRRSRSRSGASGEPPQNAHGSRIEPSRHPAAVPVVIAYALRKCVVSLGSASARRRGGRGGGCTRRSNRRTAGLLCCRSAGMSLGPAAADRVLPAPRPPAP